MTPAWSPSASADPSRPSHIRALNRAGHLRAAIAFDTSYAHGNSNWAFTQYDNALLAVIAIN